MSIAAMLVILLAVSLLLGSVWLLSTARGQERAAEVRQRLNTNEGSADDTDLPTARNRKLRNPLTRWLIRFLWRAGFEVSSSAVWVGVLIVLVLAILSFAIGGLLAGTLIVGGSLALAYGILLRRAATRRRKIVEQLPAFLENVIRVLAAGNTLEEAFGAAARESVEPIRPLFLSVARQIKLGATIDQVLTEMGTLYRLRDLRVLGLAAGVNRRYGGSLRAVLKSLIVIIRQRSMSALELRALTAETRFSAFVLAIVPISLSIFIYTRNTQYYATMYHDPTGKILLLASVALQVSGAFVLWRMLSSTEDAET